MTLPALPLASLARLALASCRASGAVVALESPDGPQVLASAGLSDMRPGAARLPLSGLLLRHVVATGTAVTVPDARRSTLVRQLAATGPADAAATLGEDLEGVAYLGVPLLSSDGTVVGAVAALDRNVREWTAAELTALQDIAGTVTGAWTAAGEAAALPALARIHDAVVSASTDAIVVIDPPGHIVEFNPAAQAMFRRGRAEALGADAIDLLLPERHRQRHRQGVAHYQATGQSTLLGRPLRTDAVRSDGSEFPIELTLTSTQDDDPTPVADRADAASQLFVAHIRDRSRDEEIGERLAQATVAVRDAELALQDERQRLQAVVDSAPTILFGIEHDGTVVVASGKSLELLGVRSEQLVGRTIDEIYAGRPDILEPTRRALQGESVHTVFTMSGRVFDTQYQPMYDPRGAVVGTVGVATDITRQVRSERALRRLAQRDALTGLSNRAHAEESITDLLRQGEPFALLLIDLDHFKDVNDSLGHPVGDQVLRSVATRISRVVPSGSVLGRLGGDEMLIGLSGAGVGSAEHIAAEVLQSITQPISVTIKDHTQRMGGEDFDVSAPLELTVTASIGIAVSPEHGTDLPSLLAHADSAMYASKRAGRATATRYEPHVDISRRRLSITTRLRRALATGSVDVVFQPLLDLDTQATVSFEALARWTDPDLGPVSPLEFVPLAEEANFIDDLFELVLDRSLAAACRWNEVPDRAAITVGVNVAPRQLRDRGFPARVEAAVREAGLPTSSLVLELTESGAMDEATSVTQVLRGLSDASIDVVIDDYGVGYSSMARLRDLSAERLISAVKLDRSFVADLPSERARTLLATFVQTTQILDLRSVAEGVETGEHLRALRQLGCPVGQGWHFARPMGAAESIIWLDR